MNERVVEQRLERWYANEVGGMSAPESLRASVADIPHTAGRGFAFGRYPAWALVMLLALLAALAVGALLTARPPSPIFSVRNGLVAYVAPVGQNGPHTVGEFEYDLFVANADGRGVHRLTFGEGQILMPSWSPDGSRIAFLGADRASVRVVDVSTGTIRPVTRVTGPGKDPPFVLAWSPDGTRLLIGDNSSVRIAELGEAGTSPDVAVRVIREHAGFPAWSADGRQVVLATFSGSPWEPSGPSETRLLVTDLATGNDDLLATHSGYWFVDPRWSPDGRWIAFHTDRGIEIIAPGSEQRRMLVPASDGEIAWSPDGSLLAVSTAAGILTANPDGGQLAVAVHAGDAAPGMSRQGWSPDGKWISYDTVDAAGGWTGTWIVRPDGTGRQRLETGPLRTMVFPVPWTWQPVR